LLLKLVGASWKCRYQRGKNSTRKRQLFKKSCTKNFLNYQRWLAMLERPSDRVYEYSRPVSIVNDLSIRGDSKTGCSLVNICHSDAPINASDYRPDGSKAARPI
jgi:hypothetical protein